MISYGKRKVVILGSTGSVGESAVKVALQLRDRIEVVGLAAKSNVKRLAEQAALLGCGNVCVWDESRCGELERAVPPGCRVFCGHEGLTELSVIPEAELILCAIVGTAGLSPVLAAIKEKKHIALASKEILVMAGRIVMDLAVANNIKMIPVDSEHSAVFQCLEGKGSHEIEKLILTASGGPFRNSSLKEMENATWEKASVHPTWAMGPKITIDSATLMNKALEMIEAHFLFNCPGDRIDVLVHPQSIVHSMVEFTDGTILAQMSVPDMRFPIQYAFTHPERVNGGLGRLDLAKAGNLSFEAPDRSRFPALDFAYSAIRSGGAMPAVMNAANEVAVERFRKGEIGFTQIWKVIEKTMSLHIPLENPDLGEILSADAWARERAASVKF